MQKLCHLEYIVLFGSSGYFSKRPWVWLSHAMNWYSKEPRVPVIKQQQWCLSGFFCTCITNPYRETATPRCLKSHHKWSLVTDLAKINEKVSLHGLFQRRPEFALSKPQFRMIQTSSGLKDLCLIYCDKACWMYGAIQLGVYIPPVTMKCKQSKHRSRQRTEDLQCVV